MFALYLAHESVGKIALQMTTDLSEVLVIFDRRQQEQAGLLRVFRSNAPASGYRQRVIENLLTARGIHRDDCELNLLLLI